jgi:hypothetical protein
MNFTFIETHFNYKNKVKIDSSLLPLTAHPHHPHTILESDRPSASGGGQQQQHQRRSIVAGGGTGTGSSMLRYRASVSGSSASSALGQPHRNYGGGGPSATGLGGSGPASLTGGGGGGWSTATGAGGVSGGGPNLYLAARIDHPTVFDFEDWHHTLDKSECVHE